MVEFVDQLSNPLYYAHNLYLNGVLVTDLIIPNSITSIGNYTFSGCSGLKSVTIPNSVTSIGSSAFSGCSSLTSVTVSDIESWYMVEFVDQLSNPLYYAHNLYLNGVLVTDLIIPNSITSIGNYTFSGCSGLKSVTIPNSVTSIGDYAFSGCSNLAEVTIPNSVSSIGYYAFTGDFPIILAGTEPAVISSTNSFRSDAIFFVPDDKVETYKAADVWKDMSDRIFGKSSLLTEVTSIAANSQIKLADAIGLGNEKNVVNLKVHGTLNGYDIMVIRNKLTNLRYLDLSDARIVADEGYEYYTGCRTMDNELGAYSFYEMDNLHTIVLPKDITSIGKLAFGFCNGIKSIDIPSSVKRIEEKAFFLCTGLRTLNFAEGLEYIGNSAFTQCSAITRLILPNSLTSFGEGAFQSCYKISELKLPENLRTINSKVFHYCNSIVDLKLPPTLERIESGAFSICTSLSAIHLPSMLNYIGSQAFAGCGAKDVYSYTLSPVKIEMDTFDFSGVLHAPQEPYSVFFDYYTDTQWSQFTNVLPFEAKYSSWYMGEDQDITLNDGETIPNEDGEQAEGTMQPGSSLNYLDGAYQWLDKLNLKWKEGHAPSIIDNSSVFVDELIFTLDVQANKWYFFSFPFDIELDKAKFNGRFVWRYYDGDERASNGQGGWKNIAGNKLNAFQGYIFQTNKSGEIELTISDPVFTGADKDVNMESHASTNNQDAGWNFIGNPNLSYYDLTCFIENFKCPITVWDPVNNTYNAIVPGDDDYTFSPFEAFFVQKPTDQNAITFESENRKTPNQAKDVLKAKSSSRMTKSIDQKRRIINISISNGQIEDKTRVVFNDDKSLFYDEACDAGKFMSSENVPQIYTLDGKNTKYAINERPNNGNIVKVGYQVSTEGTYTLSAKRMDCMMAVKDSETGIVHDFADGDYEFTSKVGTFENRFTLIPSSQITGVKSVQSVGVVLESGNGYIGIGGLNGKTATVFAANGMKVNTVSENGQINVGPGAYLVKVGDCSSKIVVK